jgi:hypothetical protein
LPLTVSIDPEGRNSEEWTRFYLELSGQNIELANADLSLDIAVLSRDETGRTIDLFSKRLTGKIKQVAEFRQKPFTFSGPIKLPKGAGNVRFVVRDRISGRMGSVIVDVSPPPRT